MRWVQEIKAKLPEIVNLTRDRQDGQHLAGLERSLLRITRTWNSLHPTTRRFLSITSILLIASNLIPHAGENWITASLFPLNPPNTNYLRSPTIFSTSGWPFSWRVRVVQSPFLTATEPDPAALPSNLLATAMVLCTVAIISEGILRRRLFISLQTACVLSPVAGAAVLSNLYAFDQARTEYAGGREAYICGFPLWFLVRKEWTCLAFNWAGFISNLILWLSVLVLVGYAMERKRGAGPAAD